MFVIIHNVWAAFTSREYFYMPVWFALIGAGLAKLAMNWGGVGLWGLSALAVGLSLLITYITYTMYDSLLEDRIKARAVRWAQSADSEDEADLRFSQIETLGAAGALGAMAGFATNVDGVPMINDSVDILGRTFGESHDIMGFLTEDVGTGMGMDSSDAYSSPFGMD